MRRRKQHVGQSAGTPRFTGFPFCPYIPEVGPNACLTTQPQAINMAVCLSAVNLAAINDLAISPLRNYIINLHHTVTTRFCSAGSTDGNV